MKKTRMVSAGIAFVLAITFSLHAQNRAILVQPAQADSLVSIVAEAQGLQPVSPADLPIIGGTFWWVMPGGAAVPAPCPPQDLSAAIYQITEGQFLVDETGGQVTVNSLQSRTQTQTTSSTVASEVTLQADAVVNLITQIQTAAANQQTRATMQAMGMDVPSPGDGGDGGSNNYSGFSSTYTIDPDALWLEITNVSGGLAYLNLHNGSNEVYCIWSTTNLATPFADWQVETELWPSNAAVLSFMVSTLNRPNLFVRAEDWTGVDSDGDGVPDWWAWKYFGNVNVTDTNLDYSGNGNTFAQDYSNNVTPTVFVFTNLEVPNNYVSSSQPAVQLDVAGTPYYVATLIDDDNFSNAVWNPYSGSTVTVNLGIVQGWHEVWIGLRGHADDPTSAVWQRKRLKLDWTPPALFITNPTNSTVDIPMIQLTGYSPEALSSISYDLSNAVGTVTNQQLLVLNQYYDTNTFEFTTNTFQAFDVMLTNGVNTFTLHATDLAGNVTTLVTNFTLDYSAKTNPPSVQITWPQPGTQISGNSFTVDGQVNDATVTVAATITDSSGNTNMVKGLVERSGTFWVENLPLNSGTNSVRLTVTDVAGNVATTNFNVTQSAVTLTVNPVAPDSQLWQPTVNVGGTISDASYAVWVNGVKGHNNGDGTWTASNVPVNDGGTASFTATGYAPNEQQPDGSYGN
jgi:hypothetical protein